MYAYIAIALASGAFAGAILVVSVLWPLVFFSLVPLLWVLVTTNRTKFQAFVLGCAWGFGLMGVSLSFVFDALPLDWLGATVPVVGVVMATILWAALAAAASTTVGLFALLVWHLREARTAVLVSVLPVAWMLLELARATLVSVLALGPGTSVGPYFTFGFLGYALAGAHGLLMIAPLGGVLFLGWCIVLLNVGIWVLLKLPAIQKKLFIQSSVCVVLLATLLMVNFLLPAKVHVFIGASFVEIGDTRAVLVHSDENASFKRSPDVAQNAQARLEDEIISSLSANPSAHVVVLPEDSRFQQVIAAPRTDKDRAALEALSTRGALLIGSGRVDDGRVARGILYMYDFSSHAPALFSAKSYLVPFGEYVPYLASAIARMFGAREHIERLTATRASYIPGDWDPEQRIVSWNGVSYGLLSCSELFYPSFMKDLSNAGADVMVSMSSQSWVRNGSPVLFNQTLGMAIVNAAWVERPYMQATNKAQNVFIDVRH